MSFKNTRACLLPTPYLFYFCFSLSPFSLSAFPWRLLSYTTGVVMDGVSIERLRFDRRRRGCLPPFLFFFFFLFSFFSFSIDASFYNFFVVSFPLTRPTWFCRYFSIDSLFKSCTSFIKSLPWPSFLFFLTLSSNLGDTRTSLFFCFFFLFIFHLSLSFTDLFLSVSSLSYSLPFVYVLPLASSSLSSSFPRFL